MVRSSCPLLRGRSEVRPLVSLAGQMYAFVMTVAAGASVGLLFDVYRVVRSALCPKRWVSVLCDAVYWLVVTPVVFLLLLVANWADLRYYVVIGMGLGLFAYFQLASAYILWACLNIQHAAGALAAGVGRCLVALCVLPFRLLGGLRLGPSGGGFFRGGAVRRSRVPPMRWRTWGLGRLFRP